MRKGNKIQCANKNLNDDLLQDNLCRGTHMTVFNKAFLLHKRNASEVNKNLINFKSPVGRCQFGAIGTADLQVSKYNSESKSSIPMSPLNQTKSSLYNEKDSKYLDINGHSEDSNFNERKVDLYLDAPIIQLHEMKLAEPEEIDSNEKDNITYEVNEEVDIQQQKADRIISPMSNLTNSAEKLSKYQINRQYSIGKRKKEQQYYQEINPWERSEFQS